MNYQDELLPVELVLPGFSSVAVLPDSTRDVGFTGSVFSENLACMCCRHKSWERQPNSHNLLNTFWT